MTATANTNNNGNAVAGACRIHDQAMKRYAQGDHKKAESLFLQTLKMLKLAEGSDHPDVAQVLNNLPAIYEDRCEYVPAEQCYRRSVRIMEKANDFGDTEIIKLRLQSWQNLGRIHQAQGRYDEAEPIFKQGLALSEQVFGSQSPEVAEALNQLGMLYKYAGRFPEAG